MLDIIICQLGKLQDKTFENDAALTQKVEACEESLKTWRVQEKTKVDSQDKKIETLNSLVLLQHKRIDGTSQRVLNLEGNL